MGRNKVLEINGSRGERDGINGHHSTGKVEGLPDNRTAFYTRTIHINQRLNNLVLCVTDSE